jgi:hypothetical protein
MHSQHQPAQAYATPPQPERKLASFLSVRYCGPQRSRSIAGILTLTTHRVHFEPDEVGVVSDLLKFLTNAAPTAWLDERMPLDIPLAEIITVEPYTDIQLLFLPFGMQIAWGNADAYFGVLRRAKVIHALNQARTTTSA